MKFAMFSFLGLMTWIITVVGGWLVGSLVVGHWITVDVFSWVLFFRILLACWTVILVWTVLECTFSE